MAGAENLKALQPKLQTGRTTASSTAATDRNDSTSFSLIFKAPYLKSTIALLLFKSFLHVCMWGLFTWIPPYLSLPVSRGGRGFGVMGTTTLLVVLNLFGMFPGYASFRLGRGTAWPERTRLFFYSLTAAFCIPLYAIAPFADQC